MVNEWITGQTAYGNKMGQIEKKYLTEKKSDIERPFF